MYSLGDAANINAGSAIASFATGGVVGAAANVIAQLFQPNVKKQTASACANNAEYAGFANLNEWNNYPPNYKTKALQIQYLNQSQQIWSYLAGCCSDPRLGSAGKNCVSERDRGGKYDFWAAYYDPILNDKAVFDPTIINTPTGPIAVPVTALSNSGASSNLVNAGTVAIQPSSMINTATGGVLTFIEQNPLIDIGIAAGLLLVLLL